MNGAAGPGPSRSVTRVLDRVTTSITPQSTPRVPTAERTPSTTRLVVLFGVYLLLLAWIVLWKLDVPWVGGVQRVIKLVPFAPSAGEGASQPSEVAVNIVLFLPFGVYLGLLAPSWRWWKAMSAATGVSLVFEVTQYVLAIGSSDVTDVIVNVAGGLAGFALLALARRRFPATTVTGVSRACSIGTVLVVLASGLVLVSPLQFGPPPDSGRLPSPGRIHDTGPTHG